MTQWQWLVMAIVALGFIAIFAIMYALYRDDDLSSLKRIGRKAAPIWRTARQVVVLVVGVTVILAGIALLVLPGPAFIVIPAGLAILATEFAWARRLLKRAHAYARNTVNKGKSRMFGRSNSESAEPSE